MNAPLTSKVFATYGQLRWRFDGAWVVKKLLLILAFVAATTQTAAKSGNDHIYYFEAFETPSRIQINRLNTAYEINDVVRIKSLLGFFDDVRNDWKPIIDSPSMGMEDEKSITLDFFVDDQKVSRLYFSEGTLKELLVERTLTDIEQATFISLISENLEL